MSFSSLDIAIFIGLFVTVTTLIFFFFGRSDKKLDERIARVSNRKKNILKPGVNTGGEASLRLQVGDDSLPMLKKLVDLMPTLGKLRDRLGRSGKKITAEKYLLYTGFLFVAVVLLTQLFLHKTILLGLLLGVIVGVGIPHMLVGRWTNARLKAFVKLFPDAIDLIVRGLRSGLPVAESIKLVGHEVPEPVAGIFQQMADRMKLGVPLENILVDTAKKLKCTEFDFFVTSIILQRETGGNLGEILNNLSEVLRQRTMMKLKIKAMTSEARASMMIIGALPFLVSLAVVVMSPGYMDIMITDYRGNIALACGCSSLFMGVFVMNKMASFDL